MRVVRMSNVDKETYDSPLFTGSDVCCRIAKNTTAMS
jgi:hypothetical protein